MVVSVFANFTDFFMQTYTIDRFNTEIDNFIVDQHPADRFQPRLIGVETDIVKIITGFWTGGRKDDFHIAVSEFFSTEQILLTAMRRKDHHPVGSTQSILYSDRSDFRDLFPTDRTQLIKIIYPPDSIGGKAPKKKTAQNRYCHCYKQLTHKTPSFFFNNTGVEADFTHPPVLSNHSETINSRENKPEHHPNQQGLRNRHWFWIA